METSNFDLSKLLQKTPDLSQKQKINYVIGLSLPGMLAQISSILMQYIDASMVGFLGANASAAIGLVASSTWVLGSLTDACGIGFTVQVANAVGAGKQEQAKNIFFRSILFCLGFSLLLTVFSVSVFKFLPLWLGAAEEIRRDASLYFLVYGLSTPLYQLIYLMSGMLQCSGNMKLPGILNAAMCLLDAFFNVIFIRVFNLGVMGAALGSTASAFIICIIFIIITVFYNKYLNLRKFKPFKAEYSICSKAVKLSIPIAVEKVAFTGALVVVTRIIAPLGQISLAANSFAVTAEALCYMPIYGIQGAVTTLTGQSMGARRKDLIKSFSWITVIYGILFMIVMGTVMYFICPFIFKFLTPDLEIQRLAIKILRIELIAEPLYGTSIICTGALRGQNDTLIPCILSLISLWIVRLGLSLLLVGKFALTGIWIAMAVELCFRGIVLLVRLAVLLKSKS
ncbi:MAG: MATE family efflux transporter [Treponema sp.]|nr:MATE family efflux transporter [Treponema sp.]